MGKTLRILLVEDDTVDAMAVERAVRERQLDGRVKVVETAEAALERLGLASEGAREADLPELILTDLHLPLLSGLDLLERLKSDSRLRRIPVVFLSTSRQTHHVFQAYDRGAAGYLAKPSSFKGFGDVLEQIVSYFTLSEAPTACK